MVYSRAYSWADDCPQGGNHDWQTILDRHGNMITVCKKCGAR